MSEYWIGRWMARWRGRCDAASDGMTWMIRAAGPIIVVCGGLVMYMYMHVGGAHV